jgi:hypothetical protein
VEQLNLWRHLRAIFFWGGLVLFLGVAFLLGVEVSQPPVEPLRARFAPPRPASPPELPAFEESLDGFHAHRAGGEVVLVLEGDRKAIAELVKVLNQNPQPLDIELRGADKDLLQAAHRQLGQLASPAYIAEWKADRRAAAKLEIDIAPHMLVPGEEKAR